MSLHCVFMRLIRHYLRSGSKTRCVIHPCFSGLPIETLSQGPISTWPTCGRVLIPEFTHSLLSRALEIRLTHFDFISESSYTVWPDEKFGPFSPQDKRFPLPGQVGAVGEPQKKRTVDPETLFKNLPSERHEAVLQRAMQVQADVSCSNIFILL